MAWAYIQGAKFGVNAASSTLQVPANLTSGNGQILGIMTNSAISSVTDDKGQTWTQRFNQVNGSSHLYLYTAPVTAGAAGTRPIVTVTQASSGFMSAGLGEFSGLDATLAVDVTTVGANSAASSITVTTAAASATGELCVSVATIIGGQVITRDAALTDFQYQNVNPGICMPFSLAGKSSTASSTFSFTDTCGSNDTWLGIAAIFTLASTGLTLGSQVATLALTAVPGSIVAGPVNLPAQVATLALTAVPGSIVAGPVNLPAQVATLALTAIPGSLVPGPVNLGSQTAVLTLTAVPGSLQAGTNLGSQQALLTLTAVPGSIVPGPVSLVSQTAVLTLTAVPATLVAGPVNLPSQIALLTLTAVPGTVVVSSPQVLPSQVATLVLTAVPGSITITAANEPVVMSWGQVLAYYSAVHSRQMLWQPVPEFPPPRRQW